MTDTDICDVAAADLAPAAGPESVNQSKTVIQPSRSWALGLSGLWEYRSLVSTFAWRDIKVRYKQTFFGAGWAIIQPVMLMVVFGIFLGRLAGLPSDGLPYPVFVLAALVPWTLFANAFLNSSQSVVKNERIISKVYFPRLVVPVSAALSFLMDFVIALGVLLLLQAAYGIFPTWRIVFVPLLAAFAILAALSIGVFLAALNVRYRDVTYTVPFLIQLWLFASPIGYPSTLIPEQWRFLYGLNPMTGVIEGFRWSVAGADTHPGPVVLVSLFVSLVFLLGGLLYFGRTERTFADVI
jgi:lipopolysaccharide transport system permease protein